jgi:hypothetical protein
MSALPVRQAISNNNSSNLAKNALFLLKIYSASYALDPYQDRLESLGFRILNSHNHHEALELALRHRPAMVLVQDDLANGIDALIWLDLQHAQSVGWLATVPLIILATEDRLPVLLREQLPDRVVVLQRRADTLNRLTQTARALLRAWSLA